MITATLVVLMCLIFGAPILCRGLKARSEDAKLFEEHGAKFYANASPLFADDQTPIEILRTLRALGRCVANKGGPTILYHVFSNPRKLLEISDSERRIRKVIEEFLVGRPELEARYMAAVWHGLLATSYRSSFYGPKIRDRLVGIETRERKQDVAFAIRSEAGDRVGDDCDRLVAA